MAALTAALVAAAAPAPPAGATAPSPCSVQPLTDREARSVDYRFGGLSEAVLTVKLPPSRFTGLLPDGGAYRLLLDAQGMATLVAAYGAVESLTVGCDHGRPAAVSEYGVFIESPDRSPGRHAYYLWQLTDDRVLVERMRALGVPSHLTDVGFSSVTEPDGRVEVAAQTLWHGSPNQLRARATEPGTTRGADVPGVRFWYEGPHGTALVAYECPACRPRTPATGSVQASSGSTLDEVLGHAAQSGSGFFIRTDLTARAQLVPAPAP